MSLPVLTCRHIGLPLQVRYSYQTCGASNSFNSWFDENAASGGAHVLTASADTGKRPRAPPPAARAASATPPDGVSFRRFGVSEPQDIADVMEGSVRAAAPSPLQRSARGSSSRRPQLPPTERRSGAPASTRRW